MKQLLFLLMLMAGHSAFGFILIDPDYKLAKPESTVVNIAHGGCRANGVDNSELRDAISKSIHQYWNTVAESRLQFKVGDEVSRTLADGAESGEVLVGCGSTGMASGLTYPDNRRGSAVVILNSTVFIPHGYSFAAMLGVLTHELGHAVGLAHSGDPASVMTYESHDWGPSAKYLSQDDKDGVVYLYGNEAQLGGLIGGCQALAANELVRPGSWWWVFFEALVILSLGSVLRYLPVMGRYVVWLTKRGKR